MASDVTNIVASNGAFLALKSDGSAVVWGDSDYGGETVLDLSSGVTGIYASDGAFAVIKDDLHFVGNTGSVQHWGGSDYGGLYDNGGGWYENGDLDGHMGITGSGVEEIFSTGKALAALKDDGSVVTWGNSQSGGDNNTGITTQLDSGIVDIKSSAGAFAAIGNDAHFEGNTGSVFQWGGSEYGGLNDNGGGWYENGDLDGHMGITGSGVEEIFSTGKAFAALKDDGSVVTWGHAYYGGDNNVGLTDELDSGVVDIKANAFAFAALKDDGSVVTWGHEEYGGDSSSVEADLGGDVTAYMQPKEVLQH